MNIEKIKECPVKGVIDKFSNNPDIEIKKKGKRLQIVAKTEDASQQLDKFFKNYLS